MPKPDRRRAEILHYLYKQEDMVTAKDLIEKLGIPKPTVYGIIEELSDQGYLDVTIKPVDRTRRYRLADKYRQWYTKGEELGIPLSFMLEGGPLRWQDRGETPIPKGEVAPNPTLTELQNEVLQTLSPVFDRVNSAPDMEKLRKALDALRTKFVDEK